MPFEVRVVGNVEASSAVQVKSQVAGPLDKVHFTEGQNVAKGDLLFEIDSRPFREALRQAEAAVESGPGAATAVGGNLGAGKRPGEERRGGGESLRRAGQSGRDLEIAT